MCYHTQLTAEALKLEKRFSAFQEDYELEEYLLSNHWNGFTFPKTPVITNEARDKIKFYNWGLIPHWTKDDSIRGYTLNAKIETLDEKPSFKHHKDHRCLVLADGFFEWKWLDPKGKKKQKYKINLPDKEPFAFGGIWSEWVDKDTGEVINTYTIVTSEAQRIMREIHNSKQRMPVILRPDQETSWLDGDDKDNYVDTEVELVAETEDFQGSLF